MIYSSCSWSFLPPPLPLLPPLPPPRLLSSSSPHRCTALGHWTGAAAGTSLHTRTGSTGFLETLSVIHAFQICCCTFVTVCRYATVCLLMPYRLYLAYHFSSSVCSGPLRRSGRLAVIEGKGEAKGGSVGWVEGCGYGKLWS